MSYVLTAETHAFIIIGESVLFELTLIKQTVGTKLVILFNNITHAYLMAAVSAFKLNYRHP